MLDCHFTLLKKLLRISPVLGILYIIWIYDRNTGLPITLSHEIIEIILFYLLNSRGQGLQLFSILMQFKILVKSKKNKMKIAIL